MEELSRQSFTIATQSLNSINELNTKHNALLESFEKFKKNSVRLAIKQIELLRKAVEGSRSRGGNQLWPAARNWGGPDGAAL
jgi:hypothetical protein